MISSKDEAKELCAKFGIKLSEHKTVIVTGNNSIYLSDNIDPADTSEKFFLKGGTMPVEEIKDKEGETEQIEEKKDKKSKK